MRRKFRIQYQRTAPSRNTILNWVRNFELRGNVENRNASERPSINSQTAQTVLSYFTAYPGRSLGRAKTDLQIHHITIHKILRIIIHMFPCKIRRIQQLKPHHLLQQKHFDARCLQNLWSDPNFLPRIVFSDECVFHVSGIANNKMQDFGDRKSLISTIAKPAE